MDAKEALGYNPPKEIAENYAKNALRLKEAAIRGFLKFLGYGTFKACKGKRNWAFCI